MGVWRKEVPAIDLIDPVIEFIVPGGLGVWDRIEDRELHRRVRVCSRSDVNCFRYTFTQVDTL
jgi:hypothetical protein